MHGSSEYWDTLVGKTVELRKAGELLRRGVVDDAAPDSSVFWLRMDGVDGRLLVSPSDAYDIIILDPSIDR